MVFFFFWYGWQVTSDKLSVMQSVVTDNPPRKEIGRLRGMFFCCSLLVPFVVNFQWRWLSVTGVLQNTRQRSVDGGSSPGGAWVVAPGGQIVATLLCNNRQWSALQVVVHLNILSKQCCVRDWISVHWDRILWRLMAGMAVCNTLCKVLYVLHCEYGGVCEYGHQMVWGRQPGPRLQDCEGLESWVTSWSGKI